jgi:two-component system, chemotaxis family, chemotaxis protein CheY
MPDHKERILVVDDAALVRLYYRQILEAAGYEVGEALNGIEALENLSPRPNSLLIVDVNMPQMDGLTFIKALRRRELPFSAVPILVTSTEAGPQDASAARDAGANFYLIKPVGRERLLEAVSLLIGSSNG